MGIRMPTVTNKQILDAFERLCQAYGVESAGMNPENITAPIDGDEYDGKTRWAIRHSRSGWMVVCGWKGSGVAIGRWNCYIRTRWDFLMFLESLAHQKFCTEMRSEKSPSF